MNWSFEAEEGGLMGKKIINQFSKKAEESCFVRSETDYDGVSDCDRTELLLFLLWNMVETKSIYDIKIKELITVLLVVL